jgi:hypothetical protein
MRLALANPKSKKRSRRINSIVGDMQLTIRIFVRRYALYGGPFKLASLGGEVRQGFALRVVEADKADEMISELSGRT